MSTPSRTFLAVRGAITIDEDTPAEVAKHTTRLLETLYERNGLTHDEVVSVLFTATPDISSVAPGVAARAFGLTDVPIICTQEMVVTGALPLCVRLLAHLDLSHLDPSHLESVNRVVPKSKGDLRHVFLRGAVALRPELAEPGDEQ